jgi:hypothetical protein
MGAFENPILKLATHTATHAKDHDVHDVFGSTGAAHALKAAHPHLKKESGLRNFDEGFAAPIETFNDATEAAHAFEKGEHLHGAKKLADTGSDVMTMTKMLPGEHKGLGLVGDGFGVASAGLKSAEELKKGEYLKGSGSAAKAAGKGANLIEKLGGGKMFGKLGSGLGAVSSGIGAVDKFRHGDVVEGLENTADTVAGVANTFGGPANPVGLVAKSYSAGSAMGRRGSAFAKETGLLGKDHDGNNRDISDAAADHGVENELLARQLLGDSGPAKLASKIAGFGTVATDSVAGAAASVPLAVAGYAKDAWDFVKSPFKSASSLFEGLF